MNSVHTPPATAPRIGSLDVYRGIVMFLLGLRRHLPRGVMQPPSA
ncbi:hypothetical protein [Prosthecobacter sp.]|nr:hypothetical protein [Prosthecobacter sp.]